MRDASGLAPSKASFSQMSASNSIPAAAPRSTRATRSSGSGSGGASSAFAYACRMMVSANDRRTAGDACVRLRERVACDARGRPGRGPPGAPALPPGAYFAPPVDATVGPPARLEVRVRRVREVREELRHDERFAVPRDPAAPLRLEERVKTHVREAPVDVRVEQDCGGAGHG